MASFFDFDEIGDFDIFSREFMKRIQRKINEIEKAVKSGKIKGKWDVKQIDKAGVKGYVIQGRFWSDQPFGPFDPFEPLEPWGRRPMPKRPFRIPESTSEQVREPLTDLFDEEKAIKIYVELPGEEKDDIQLNVTKGKFEVKTKRFYKMIDLPTRNIDIENASSKYKNGVLEVTIPKKEKSPEEEKRKVKIE